MTSALTVVAGVVLLASGVCLGVFFSTEREAWGRTNDATIALWALLMAPAAFEVYLRYGDRSRWVVGGLTALALVGEIVVAATSGLTAVGLLDWKLSAKIGSLGFCAFATWMAGVSGFVFAWGGLPRAFAWFGIVTLVLAVAAALLGLRHARAGGLDEQRMPPPATSGILALAFLCLVAWCVWLGVAL